MNTQQNGKDFRNKLYKVDENTASGIVLSCSVRTTDVNTKRLVSNTCKHITNSLTAIALQGCWEVNSLRIALQIASHTASEVDLEKLDALFHDLVSPDDFQPTHDVLVDTVISCAQSYAKHPERCNFRSLVSAMRALASRIGEPL